MKNKNGHETDLKMSPRPLGTTIFDEIQIRIPWRPRGGPVEAPKIQFLIGFLKNHVKNHVNNHVKIS